MMQLSRQFCRIVALCTCCNISELDRIFCHTLSRMIYKLMTPVTDEISKLGHDALPRGEK